MNNFTLSGAEAPVWQGAKVQEYVDIASFCNAVRRDEPAVLYMDVLMLRVHGWTGAVKNVKLFIDRPLT